MSLSEMMQAVSDNGITVVLAVIFIWVIIKFINFGFAKLDKHAGNKKHDNLIKLRTEIGEEIQILLDDFLKKSKGNSIQVIEFSNSVTSVAYLPFRYMTCTYESCKFGVSSNGSKIDRMSTSLFTPFFSELQKVPYCEFDVRKKEHMMGGAMYDLMQTIGETKSLCAMLTTVRGKAIGYVSFQKTAEFTQEDIKNIQSLAKQLSALLCVVDTK